jgi:hypothetical protein
MYRLEICHNENREITCDDDFEIIAVKLNYSLSKELDKNPDLIIEESLSKLQFEKNNEYLGVWKTDHLFIYLSHETNNSHLDSKYLYLLPYFLLNKELIRGMTDETYDRIVKLDPHILLEIFTYSKNITHPYNLLTQLYHLNEEIVYQIFILYLNKTLKVTEELVEFHYDTIINHFHPQMQDPESYHQLLLYYLKAKQILPFNVHFQPYKSQLENLILC